MNKTLKISSFIRENCIKLLTSILLMLVACMMMPSVAKADGVSGFWQYCENNDGNVYITSYTGAEENVTVPSKLGGKKVIGMDSYSGVFSGNKFIETVYIPDSVQYIGRCSFSGCENLTKITGCKGINAIGYRAFENCLKLQTYPFTNKVSHIGDSAFNNCQNLQSVTLYTGLTFLGAHAFYNCDSITSISIPANVEEVGYQAVAGCDSLKSVTVGSNTPISGSMFSENPSLQSVALSNGCKGIGERAFQGCNNLYRISIPESVRYIGQYAFRDCTSLSSVNLSKGLLEIHDGAFYNTAVTDVVIPNMVYLLGYDAFRQCPLNSIVIPRSVTEIDGYYFFKNINNATIYCWADSHTHNLIIELGYTNYTLYEDIPCSSIKFTASTIYLFKDETKKLSLTVNPFDTTDAVTWESSSSNIASVDRVGEVTAKETGSATIVATTTNGKRATINVVVSNPPTSVYFTKQSKNLIVGGTYTQKATVKDSNGLRNDVIPTYKSSNTAIATVSSTGKVTAKKAGTVYITATTAGLTARYKLTVVTKYSLSQSSIALSKYSYTYTGKTCTPAVSVKYDGASLKKGTDYTVKYSNNKNAGTAKVIIAGKGKYSGTITKTFKINKAKAKITVKSTSYKKTTRSKAFLLGAKVNSKGKLSYVSSNSKVVKVSSNGKVTIKGKGTATITVKAAAKGNYLAATKKVRIIVK